MKKIFFLTIRVDGWNICISIRGYSKFHSVSRSLRSQSDPIKLCINSILLLIWSLIGPDQGWSNLQTEWNLVYLLIKTYRFHPLVRIIKNKNIFTLFRMITIFEKNSKISSLKFPAQNFWTKKIQTNSSPSSKISSLKFPPKISERNLKKNSSPKISSPKACLGWFLGPKNSAFGPAFLGLDSLLD